MPVAIQHIHCHVQAVLCPINYTLWAIPPSATVFKKETVKVCYKHEEKLYPTLKLYAIS